MPRRLCASGLSGCFFSSPSMALRAASNCAVLELRGDQGQVGIDAGVGRCDFAEFAVGFVGLARAPAAIAPPTCACDCFRDRAPPISRNSSSALSTSPFCTNTSPASAEHVRVIFDLVRAPVRSSPSALAGCPLRRYVAISTRRARPSSGVFGTRFLQVVLGHRSRTSVRIRRRRPAAAPGRCPG